MKTNETTIKKGSWLDKQAQIFEINRFGAMSIMMIFQSCLASISAGLVVDMVSVIPLIITVITAMGSNAIFIAQGPAKYCIVGFLISIAANALIIMLSILIK